MTFKMIKRFLWFFLLMIVFVGCGGKEKTGLECVSPSEGFFAYKFDDVNKQFNYSFNFYDCNGVLQESKEMRLQEVVAIADYDYKNKKVLLAGAGGVLNVDLATREISKLSDMNISKGKYFEEGFFAVENLPFTSVDTQKNVLHRYDGDFKVVTEVDFIVGGMGIMDGKVYLSNQPMFDGDDTFFEVYRLDGKFEKRTAMPSWGTIVKGKDTLYYQTETSMTDLENNTVYNFKMNIDDRDNNNHNYEDINSRFYLKDYKTCVAVDADGEIKYNDCHGIQRHSDSELTVVRKDGVYTWNFENKTLTKEPLSMDEMFRYNVIKIER